MKPCLFFLSGLLLLLAGGCSSEKSAPVATLEGSVTIGGKPIPGDAEATLNFTPAARGEARAVQASIKDGRYRAEKVPVGQIQVIFNITRKTGKIIKITPDDLHPTEERINLVPLASRQGLPLEVKGDNPQQNFDLK